MITAVDTNVLLDLLIPNAPHSRSSKALLDRAFTEGALVVCEVVYAELAAQFPAQSHLETFLSDTAIELRPSIPQALHRSSAAWKAYLT